MVTKLGLTISLLFMQIVLPADRWSAERYTTELDCSVVSWEILPKQPATLTIACPEENTFSPINIFFKFHWPQQSNKDYLDVVGLRHTPVKFRAPSSIFEVKLRYVERKEEWTEMEFMGLTVLQKKKGEY